MKPISLFGLLLLLSSASSVLAQKVAVDWDHDADFSKYRTYAWIESKSPGNDLAAKRIIAAIDSQLTAKGLQKTQQNDADLAVVYNVGAKERVSVQGYDYGYGRYRWGGGTVRYDTTAYTEATVVVDLVDAKARSLVWRGTASDTVSDKPEKNEKKIQKAAEKMFKKYPPSEG
jgi:hypothetical protein